MRADHLQHAPPNPLGVVPPVDGKHDQRDFSGVECLSEERIPLLAVIRCMGRIVQFHGGHDACGPGCGEHEVDMLLSDSAAVGLFQSVAMITSASRTLNEIRNRSPTAGCNPS